MVVRKVPDKVAECNDANQAISKPEKFVDNKLHTLFPRGVFGHWLDIF
jgi:hypothetical protein